VNPDKYIDINNKIIASCFTITKSTGILKISTPDKWKERLEILKKTIDYWMKNTTDKTIELIKLFYNQNLIIN
jgi:hypothetical protein